MYKTITQPWKSIIWATGCILIRWVYRMGQPFFSSNPKIAIFAGRGKRAFAGNPKHLFEHCYSGKDLDCYWLARDRTHYRILRKQFGKRVLYVISLRTVYVLWRAKFVFIAGSIKVAHPYPLSTKDKVIINLWHGAAVKKLGHARDAPDSEETKGQEKQIAWEKSLDFTYFVVSSNRELEIISARFRCGHDKIWVTGLPRNDGLVKGSTSPRPTILPPGKKIVLYAPTWRDHGGTAPVLPLPDLDLTRLDKVLSDQEAVLVIRPHPKEVEHLALEAKRITERSNHILYSDNEDTPDTNALLPHIDVLITDYSSIFVDYLLTDRPIIFVPHDYEEYAKNRGLVWDYWADAPGPKPTEPDEFFDELERSLLQPNHFCMERRSIVKKFHDFTDGAASERIVQKIKDKYLK